MDPMTLMALIGTATNVIGNIAGPNESTPQQINPLTDSYFQDILGELGMWNQQQANATQQAGQNRRGVEQAANRAQSYESQIGKLEQPGVNDFFYNFMDEMVPGYRAEAAKVAEAATRGGAVAQQERAQQLADQAAQTVAGQYAGSGGMFSGAMGKAVGEGAVNPLADYQAQMGEQYQNAFMGAYTPLAQQGQGLAYQAKQSQFNNAINQLMQQMQGAQLGGSLQGTAMSGALNEASLAGQRAQGAESYRHDVAQPFYATPNLTPNPLSNVGNALTDMAAYMPNSWTGDANVKIPGRNEPGNYMTDISYGDVYDVNKFL